MLEMADCVIAVLSRSCVCCVCVFAVVIDGWPRNSCLPDKCTAMVEITLARPVCLELFAECKQLGRFTLRSENRTIAAGIVTRKFKNLRSATKKKR